MWTSNLYGEAAKTCQSIVGYDANALYLWCIMQDIPTGCYVKHKEEDQFKPHQPDVWGKTASEWIDWIAHTKCLNIRHKYNGKEKRIWQWQLPVDGYCAQTNTVYQFHGCYLHGHNCMQEKGSHPEWQEWKDHGAIASRHREEQSIYSTVWISPSRDVGVWMEEDENWEPNTMTISTKVQKTSWL